MLNISPALKDELLKGTFCSLVRITTEQGVVFGYTDYPVELTYQSTKFEPTPSLQRLRSYQTTESQSNNQRVELVQLGDFSESELLGGMFDNAVVEVMRVVPSRLDLGHILLTKEGIAAAKWDAQTLEFNVLDLFRSLQKQIGTQNSPYCRHTFGDSFSPAKKGACTLNTSSFTYNVTVTSIVKQKMQFTINSSRPDMWFANGVVTWTMGYNAGASGTIKSDKTVGNVHTLTMFIPTTFNITVGDTIKVVVGCDGSFGTCNSKFANGRNFGGNPLLNPGVNQR